MQRTLRRPAPLPRERRSWEQGPAANHAEPEPRQPRGWLGARGGGDGVLWSLQREQGARQGNGGGLSKRRPLHRLEHTHRVEVPPLAGPGTARVRSAPLATWSAGSLQHGGAVAQAHGGLEAVGRELGVSPEQRQEQREHRSGRPMVGCRQQHALGPARGDGGAQLGTLEWLAHDGNVGGDVEPDAQAAASEPRDQDDRSLGAPLPDLRRERHSADFGHYDVGDHDIDLVLGEHAEGLSRAGCGEDVQALPTQLRGDGLAHDRLVVDQEHRAAQPRIVEGGAGRLGGAGRIDGQEQVEHGADADIAAHEDRSTVAAHGAVDGGKAQPGALADRLGREERLEDSDWSCGGMPSPVSSTVICRSARGE